MAALLILAVSAYVFSTRKIENVEEYNIAITSQLSPELQEEINGKFAVKVPYVCSEKCSVREHYGYLKKAIEALVAKYTVSNASSGAQLQIYEKELEERSKYLKILKARSADFKEKILLLKEAKKLYEDNFTNLDAGTTRTIFSDLSAFKSYLTDTCRHKGAAGSAPWEYRWDTCSKEYVPWLIPGEIKPYTAKIGGMFTAYLQPPYNEEGTLAFLGGDKKLIFWLVFQGNGRSHRLYWLRNGAAESSDVNVSTVTAPSKGPARMNLEFLKADVVKFYWHYEWITWTYTVPFDFVSLIAFVKVTGPMYLYR